ncbi:MAG: hypothetical protein JNJ41_02505 [Bacteroidia bacterium]|nr:hypothetical protein [Bacteroidia bacterium]
MEHLEYYKATSECKRNAEKSINTCFHPGCQNKSINSHILQKNGILSSIAPDKHLWQIEESDFDEGLFKFQQRGLNAIFCFNGFCNEHDTKLFQKIEGGTIDFDDYESCLLFTLRTLYNEIYRKEVNILHYQCLMERIPKFKDSERCKAHMEGDRKGIEDMRSTEKEIWDDLTNKTESFVFSHRELNRVELCISSFYTYDTSFEMEKFKDHEKPSDIFINLFPYKGKSVLLMGYHKPDEKKVKGYFNAFFKESERRILRPITNLILFQCETWVCSDNFHKVKVKGFEPLFYDAIKFSTRNYNERKVFDINIFESDFHSRFRAWANEFVQQKHFINTKIRSCSIN